MLYLYAFGFLAFCTMFNGCGVSITKYSTATNRAIIEQSRVLVIWLFFLMKPGFGHEVFSNQKLLGFILIVLGVLFFNKIFVFDGLSIKYQGGEKPKANISLKKNESDEDVCLKEEAEELEDDYILPKLQLEDDQNQLSTNSTDTNENNLKRRSSSTCSQRITIPNSLSTVNEGVTESDATPQSDM